MQAKYADVVSLDEALEYLASVTQRAGVAGSAVTV